MLQARTITDLSLALPPFLVTLLLCLCSDRTFLTNIPTLETPRFSTLHELVRSLNPNIFIECMPRSLRNGYSADPEVGMKIFNDSEYIKNFDHSAWYGEGAELFQAIDLLKRCLNMDLTKRTTARQALSHPFFSVRLRSPFKIRSRKLNFTLHLADLQKANELI